MNFKYESSVNKPLTRINLMAVILSFSLPFILCGACSEEEPRDVQKPRMVVRMKIPPQQKPPAPKQAELKSKEQTPEITKTAALEKKKVEAPLPVKAPKKKKAKKVSGTYYKVRKGDSLFKVAGRKDVYGDGLKWPSLYLLNMNKLKGIEVTENFPRKKLPLGLDLRFVTPKEAAKNLTKLGQKFWVVNVLSSQSSKKIVPAAVKLMKNGCPVYIAKVMVKGKEWMRLRAGFFEDRKKATEAGEKIKSIIDADGAWITKIGKKEQERFGGY